MTADRIADAGYSAIVGESSIIRSGMCVSIFPISISYEARRVAAVVGQQRVSELLFFLLGMFEAISFWNLIQIH